MLVSSRTSTSRDLLEQKILKIFSKGPLLQEQIVFILDSYSEPWRQYHNCDHILKMLDLLQVVGAENLSADDIHAIQVMIIYHDVVYKIGREKGWNESESAAVASRQLKVNSFSSDLLDLVCTGIIATTNHELPDAKWKHLMGLFLDIDLFVGFGATWKEFDANTKLLETEFSPLYTVVEYRDGRAKFAKTFLERDAIFITSHFCEYEQEVRRSLSRMSKCN